MVIVYSSSLFAFRLLSLDDGAEKEEQTSKAEPAAKLQGIIMHNAKDSSVSS